MPRFRVLIVALAGAALLGAAPARADTGVSIDVARIAVAERLSPGGEYRLPVFRVRNPGTEPTTYRLDVTALDDQAELSAPESWFRFSPATFTLAPGESRVVATRLEVPAGADPGEYFALVGPRIVAERSGAQVGATAAARLTFDVEPSSTLDAWWREAKRFASEHAPWSWLIAALLVSALAASHLRRRYSLSIARRT